jgi:arylsulfatase A
MPSPHLKLFGLLAATLSVSVSFAAPPQRPLPNVVFILADDAGIADIARYHEHFMGTPAAVPTPHLDRLCREGMLFTDAQLPAALCAPNRFSLLTGSNPNRSRTTGTWNRTSSTGLHFERTENAREQNPHRTIGSVLQDAGYRTGYFGKMHIGGDFFAPDGTLLRNQPNDRLGEIDYTRRFENGMLAHGFDTTFVSPDGIQGPMYAWFENDRYVPVSDFAARVPGLAADGPPSVLRAFAKGERVGHGEMLVPGWGDSRFDTSEHGPILGHFATRFIEDHVASHPDRPFFVYYATPAIHEPLTPEADLVGASGLDLRADFVMDLDRQVGRLLAALDRLKIADNTLVIFTSDNGGAIKGGARMIAAGQHPNGPFRGNKATIYEGGHRVSFVWKWGDGSATGSHIPPGVVCNQLVSVLDWVPTLLQLVGAPAAAKDQHMDSTSLLPLLTSHEPDTLPPVRRWHLHRGDVQDPRVAARLNDEAGKWLLIQPTDTRPMELYDLATDLAQKNNFVDGHPAPAELPADHPQYARVQKMDRWLTEHARPRAPRTTAVVR